MEKNLYIKALHFLKARPRSEKEVVDSLKSKGGKEEEIIIVIQKLREQKFVNDEDFAFWWIESRMRFRQKGWKIILLELKEKGINTDIANKARERVYSENDDLIDEQTVLRQLIQKKIKKYKDLPRQEVYYKLGGYLARRGFGWDDIRTCIDEVLSKSV